MRAFLLTTAAVLAAAANPANAQILGGGGIIGGAPIPNIPVIPTIPSLPATIPSAPISAVTNGAINAAANASVTKSINLQTGNASATGAASGTAAASLVQTLDSPLASSAANAAASGNFASAASLDAQLFGTDAVRGTLSQARDTAGNLVTAFKDRAGNLVIATRDKAGDLIVTTRDKAGNLLATVSSVSGEVTASVAGSANGSFSGLSQNLALDGSAAGDAAGSFDVKPGTQLFGLNGEKVGKVKEVFADAAGHVKGLLVKSGDTTALFPESDFAAKGEALVTVLSQAQILGAGEAQSNGSANGSANSIFSGLSHNLALDGSAAANNAGSFDVKPGTQLFDMSGEKIGKIKEVVADASGRIKALVVNVKDTTATLPAADFAANGDVLVTVMSAAQISATGEKMTASPAAAQSQPSSNAN
ncbi:PRC-barrel domain-containing protein [Novosphingobium aquiterrae]|uniref:PRC-barrel domain-containing protein n=1 Tax=Novosphingobium aquiterrae TaxID=624388 RepID=A0ABV6PHA1_9SPHN